MEPNPYKPFGSLMFKYAATSAVSNILQLE